MGLFGNNPDFAKVEESRNHIMYTIRYCVLESIHTDSVIEAISDLKNSPLVEWNTCSIADCAVAALDLLGVEPYKGDKVQILDMISTRFFADEK